MLESNVTLQALPAATPLHTAAPAGKSAMPPRAQAVLDYWFGESWEAASPDEAFPDRQPMWFGQQPEVDSEIRRRFSPDHEALLAGKCDSWPAHGPTGALAAILLADQLTRNAFRGSAKMYEGDERALAWAKEMLTSGADRQLTPIQRIFVYLPLMHHESVADQEECVALFESLQRECQAGGLPSMAKFMDEGIAYAKAHEEVVRRWGRYPHRNDILGRPSTAEEAAGLAAGTIGKW